jgi:subtilisin-like proprotein convertase family protein
MRKHLQKFNLNNLTYTSAFCLSKGWLICSICILLSSVGYSQSYAMDGTPIIDCSGFFYDSGGSTGDYGSSESLTTTICSDATDGTHVQLIFSAVELAAGDALCFFDGPDATAPALACNGDFMVGSPFIIQATAANTTGCLTITFNSDGNGEAAGWQADMNCIPSCQTILANLVDSDPVVSPVDTGYIDICQGERVFLYGEGIYPQDGVVYNHSDLISSFEWDFGDGTFGLGPNVSHIYEESGGYIIQLTITDQFGCTNTNFLNQRVRVSTNPSFSILAEIDDALCAGDTIQLNAIINPVDSTYSVGVSPNEGSFPTSGSRSDSLALPDGTGAAYETSIGFSNFSPGQVLTNVNDLVSICVIMEHSWLRDLEISIECPDGTSIILHDHPGLIGGEVFLGEPFEADEALPEPVPGVGYEYCWTPDATNGTWIEYANNTGVGTLPAGDYNSFDLMSNLLGCPLNGEWTISVQDLWGTDNGFIFEWSIEFEPSLYPSIETFTPQIIDYNWGSNPSIFFQTNDSIAAAPQNAGTASYTFEIMDDFGCTYDTSIFITILPPTRPDCFSCPDPESMLPDTSICDGEIIFVDAESTTNLESQAITFETFPTYEIGFANHPPSDPFEAQLEVTSINSLTIINAEAQICGVCVNLETDFDGDIRLYLKSPSGQTMELSTNNGGAGDNYTNTCFTPTASTSIIGSPAPFTGEFIPEGDWSDLNGSTINGVWELLVSDGFGVTKFGVLNSWSICFNTENDVEYSWSAIAGLSCYNCPDPVASPSATSTYVLEVSDAYGCSSMDTMTISVASNISAPANVTCDTMGSGNLNFTWDAVGGFSNYLVNVNGTGWVPSNGVLSHLVSGLSNGDIVTVEVQVDALNVNCPVAISSTMCTYFLCEISLEVPANGITGPSCFNTNDGSVIVQAMGNGTGPYSYTLDNNPPQAIGVFNVGAGDHVIIFTDVDGCADTVMVNVPTADSIFVDVLIDDILCFGDSEGNATATGSGGTGTFSYAWSTSPVLTFDPTINSVPAGDYTVTVTDGNGCEVEAMIAIEEPEVLDGFIAPTQVLCFEGNDGSATVFPTGGVEQYFFNWSNGSTGPSATSLIAGTYTVTITDNNGCVSEVEEMIGEPTGMVLTLISTDLNCNGDNSGDIDLGVTGGMIPYTYLWDDGEIIQDRSLISANTYCVTITDANNCTQDTCLTISEPTALVLDISSTTTTCMGNNIDGTATVVASGGAAGGMYTFLWNDSQTNSTASNLNAATYVVTVTDGNDCTAVESIDVNSPDAIVIDSIIPIDILCNGGNTGFAEVFASGGNGNFTYLWSDQLAQFSNPANSLPTGTYAVTITDANMCTATASIFVDEPDVLSTTINPTDVLCFGGNDGVGTANPVGGVEPYNYAWNTLPGQFTQDVNTLIQGDYTVTVTDFNGCTTSTSMTINEPATAISAVVNQTFEGCFDQNESKATVTPVGGTGINYAYEWNNMPASIMATASNLAAQNYAVIVTDENGCQTTVDVLITELEEVIASAINVDPSCFEANDGQLGVNIVNGGVGGGDLNNYNYAWSNASNNQLNSNLVAGDYTLTVTDAQGCSGEAVYSLSQPAEITATAIIDDTDCFGSADGQINIQITTQGGGFPIDSYQWDANANNQISQIATDLALGNYLVTITDNTNCSTVTSFEIKQPTPIEASFVVEDNPCFNDNIGTISTTTNGGSPEYSYEWTNTDTVNIFSSTDQNLTDLFANAYSVMITDGNGCTQIEVVNLNSPAALWAIIDADSVTCYDDQDGSLYIEAQGGMGSYQYSLDGDNFSATNNFLGLEVGNYATYIEDRNGCTATISALVEGPEELTVDLGDNITINLGETANLNAIVSPAGNYFYTWSPEDSLTCATVDCPSTDVYGLFFQSTYQVSIEDEFGCQAEDFINIFINKFRRVFVPTGFSPFTGNENDLLRTHGDEGTIVKSFKVYDRWGESVYENNIPYGINETGIGWDGTFKGKIMNPAVFVWSLEVEYIDGEGDVLKGQTTLVR